MALLKILGKSVWYFFAHETFVQKLVKIVRTIIDYVFQFYVSIFLFVFCMNIRLRVNSSGCYLLVVCLNLLYTSKDLYN